MKREKLQNIEFLRFGFATTIIYYHIFHAGKNCFGQIFKEIPLVQKLMYGSYGGFFAVDMFFILAGFFLFLKFNPQISVKDFVKKKIIRLYPLIVLFAAVTTLLNIFVYKIPHYLPREQILRLLLIDNIGLNISHSGITWYVSALFWGLLLYFYMAKIFEKKYFNLIVAFAIVFCYSYIVHAWSGYINNSHTVSWSYVFNGGMMRSIAGIGCGYIICKFYKNLKNYAPNNIKLILYTCAEGYLMYFVFNNLLFYRIHYKENFIVILGFIGLFILFLLKRGIISKFFDNKVSVFLGKYSYSIFIIHAPVLGIINRFLCLNHTEFVKSHVIFIIISSIICVIFAGIITYHLFEKPAANYLKTKL